MLHSQSHRCCRTLSILWTRSLPRLLGGGRYHLRLQKSVREADRRSQCDASPDEGSAEKHAGFVTFLNCHGFYIFVVWRFLATCKRIHVELGRSIYVLGHHHIFPSEEREMRSPKLVRRDSRWCCFVGYKKGQALRVFSPPPDLIAIIFGSSSPQRIPLSGA